MRLRKLWCRKVVEAVECSFFTKGARWSFGCDGYIVDVTYLIPFWIRDDKVDEYIGQNQHEEWLYDE